MTDETNAEVIVARRLFEGLHGDAAGPTALTTALWGEVEDWLTYVRAAGRDEEQIGGMVDRAVSDWAHEDGSEDERLPGARLRARLGAAP